MLEPPRADGALPTSPMKHAGDRASLGFAAGVGAVVAVFCAACLLVAQREWFVFDDFFFLRYVQEARPWVWLDPRVAMVDRVWPFYRPLGMQTFYYVGLQLFGLNAVGFTALALLVDLLTGLLVLRIARWLGFGWPAAAASAVLAATRGPATYVLFEAFSFQYTSAVFFYALAVVCFLEHLRKGGLRYQVASCVALGLGLFCNEVVLTLPGVLALAALIAEDRSAPARTLGRTLLRIAPQLLIITGYLVFRFALLAPVEMPSFYNYAIGAHVSRNLARLLAYAFGGGPALGLAAVLATSIVWSAHRSETTPPRALGRLLEVQPALRGVDGDRAPALRRASRRQGALRDGPCGSREPAAGIVSRPAVAGVRTAKGPTDRGGPAGPARRLPALHDALGPGAQPGGRRAQAARGDHEPIHARAAGSHALHPASRSPGPREAASRWRSSAVASTAAGSSRRSTRIGAPRCAWSTSRSTCRTSASTAGACISPSTGRAGWPWRSGRCSSASCRRAWSAAASRGES